jgi:site-specific DNA-methyltransferase (adenine-specific)
VIKAYIDTITAGNCLDLLKRLPDNSVDMAFADPPFNLKKIW